MTTSDQQVSHRITAARALAVVTLCLVPVSTALVNVGSALFVLTLLSAPEFWRNVSLAWRHRVGLAALLLLFALAASVSWSVAPGADAWAWVSKYRKLLLLPLAIVAFRGANWVGTVYWSWFAVLCAVTLLSTLNYLGLTSLGPLYPASLPASRAWVFKNHITAGLFGALLMHQALYLSAQARRRVGRIGFGVIAAWAFLNVFLMLEGRSGQVIGLLFLLFAIFNIRRRAGETRAWHGLRISARLLGLGLLLAGLLATEGDRAMKVVSETTQYMHEDAVTSTGLRLEWLAKGKALIAERPILGYGAGGLGTEFAKLSEGKSGAQGQLTLNPHDEYLLMGVQLGLLGIVLFGYLIVQIGRAASTLEPRARHLLLGWLVAFAIASFANSLLLDFSEGHLTMLLSGILLGCGWREVHRGDQRLGKIYRITSVFIIFAVWDLSHLFCRPFERESFLEAEQNDCSALRAMGVCVIGNEFL